MKKKSTKVVKGWAVVRGRTFYGAYNFEITAQTHAMKGTLVVPCTITYEI